MKRSIALLLSLLMVLSVLFGCTDKEKPVSPKEPSNKVEDTKNETKQDVVLSEGEIIIENPPVVGALVYQKSIEKEYAKTFNVDYFEGGYTLLRIENEGDFLIIPEGKETPAGLDPKITTIKLPLTGVYIANTPTMSLLKGLNSMNVATFTGTEAKDWLIEDIKKEVEEGRLLYAGKYSEPDYEMLVDGNCNFVVQSGMVDSKPEVKAKFEELGIPLMVDRSGQENHPLAKAEWFKLYAALFGIDMEIANNAFNNQVAVVEELNTKGSTGKTVSVFFISSKGTLYARNTDDYLTKMVELAGGEYIFKELDNSGSNSTQMEMESFYDKAKDADYILYMYSLGGKPNNLQELLDKNALLEDFKAVKDGNVWATCPEFFQIADSLGSMVGDINTMLTNDSASELEYVFKLQ